MPQMHVLADETRVAHLVDQLTEAIMKDVVGAAARGGRWGLVGIRRRGDVLADRLMERLSSEAFEGRVGYLDITLYRDDLSEIGGQPVIRTTEIPFDIAGLNIVLVDDVLMSGRSIRAGLQSLMDLGRPRRVWLSVLVDRGGRELPIAPDHVALDLSSDRFDASQTVEVFLKPVDPRDEIAVRSLPVSEGIGS